MSAAGHIRSAVCVMDGWKWMEKSQQNPTHSEVPQFLWGQGSVFVGNLHSVRLVIIRLEIASEAVSSLVALVTALAPRLS